MQALLCLDGCRFFVAAAAPLAKAGRKLPVISLSQDKSSGTSIQMITELGKTSSVLSRPSDSLLLNSLHEKLLPSPQHHVEHISLLVLVDIGLFPLLYLRALLLSCLLFFFSLRIAFAFDPSKVSVAVSAASSVQEFPARSSQKETLRFASLLSCSCCMCCVAHNLKTSKPKADR